MTNASRRRLLRAGGVAAVSTLAGCSGLFDSTRERDRIRDVDVTANVSQRVDVEAVREERDVTAIDGIVRDAEDGTLLYFPPGEYVVEGSILLEDVSDLALVGNDATLIPADPVEEDEEYLLSLIGSQLHVEGFTVDIRGDGYGGRVQILGDDEFVCRDVEVVGVNAATGLFVFEMRNPEGSGVVERLTARDGSPESGGMLVAKRHAGELIVRDCRFEGFKGNGLYGSPPSVPGGGDGVVKVEGGEFRNNNIANVRLGSTGSYVRNATVVVDDDIPPTSDGVVNSRGVWLHGGGDMLVEDCTILLAPPANGDGAIVLGGHTGAATVRGTDVRVDADLRAIDVSLSDGVDGDATFRCEECVVAGDASGDVAISVTDRDGSRFSGVTVTQRGEDRDGFLFRRSRDNAVRDVDVDVTGQRFVLEEDSTVRGVGSSE
ncbi:hypothetical protein ACFPYI_02265 [Halomarina salina]|uniref:Right-handed parallel beta-helix repeat-containing protein n=1 Tax=Halomarina salina TaxID=1872699 RepID=A0ABD5RI57_9EURY|nr:hypothetical protein [Halomarina salina]